MMAVATFEVQMSELKTNPSKEVYGPALTYITANMSTDLELIIIVWFPNSS